MRNLLSVFCALAALGALAGCGGITFATGPAQPYYDTSYDYGYAGGILEPDVYNASSGSRLASGMTSAVEDAYYEISLPGYIYKYDNGRSKPEVVTVLRYLMNTIRVQDSESYRRYHAPMTSGWNYVENLEQPWTSAGAGLVQVGREQRLRLHSLEGSLAYVTYAIEGVNGDERLLSVHVDGQPLFRDERNAGLYIGFARWGGPFTWFGPLDDNERWDAVFQREEEDGGTLIGEGLLAVAVFNGDALDLSGVRVEMDWSSYYPEPILPRTDSASSIDDLIATPESYSRDAVEPARGLPLIIDESGQPRLKTAQPVVEEETAWLALPQQSTR